MQTPEMPRVTRQMLLTPRPPHEFRGVLTIPEDLIDGYGHVNNAKYLEIYQKQRDLYLVSLGKSLEDLHREFGIRAFVTDGQEKYKTPVFAGEEVEVRTVAAAFRRLIVFNQDMYRNGKLVSYFDCIAWVVSDQGKSMILPTGLKNLIATSPS